MALPYSNFQQIANALAIDTNVNLPTELAQNAGSVEVQLNLAGFSGTVEFDGSIDGATWVPLPYMTLSGGALAPSGAALSFTTSTTTPTYVITLPMPFMRLTMTRSAGTFTAWVRGYSNPFVPSGVAAPQFNVATFAKPDVTAAGTSGAWTTANTGLVMFTATGLVKAQIVGQVTTPLTSTGATGTLAVATGGAGVGTLIAATTVDGTKLHTTGYLWVDTSGITRAILVPNTGNWFYINGATVTLLIATNNMSAGGMTVSMPWVPVTPGATLVAAAP